MRVYPSMSYRQYILKHALQTKDGKFYCDICQEWIDHQRWCHFKKHHQYKKVEKVS